MARSTTRDTHTDLLAGFTVLATLLLSSLAVGSAFADTDPPLVPNDCTNVIYAGETTAPPACPTNVSVTPGVAQETVSWTPPANDGGFPVTAYVVQYSLETGTTWVTAPTNPPVHPTDPVATTNIVSGLTPGTLYVFRVAAVTKLGVGNFSPNTDPTAPLGARGSTLSVVGHGKSVVRGSSTTVRVTLLDGPTDEPVAGESITLRRRIGASGAWHFVRFAQTNKEGMASVVIAPRVTTEYRWTFASDSLYTPVASGVQTVTVRRY